MKHSSSNSMSDSKVVQCDGKWNSILKKLYVDLFNLIVESRIPGIDDRGYGDGSHCPPIKGSNSHLCDLSKSECQNHQRLIHHLLKAVSHNVFEIEVLMLPDCCSEIKLNERLKNKEYVLLERWSMKCTNGKTQSAIEISELLRAIRSFLHFSQLSAWLSLTKGKAPSNIYYWVKPTLDSSTTTFETSSKVHLFPVCKISDGLQGIVKVDFPPRKQYIPIIPCSKHPPLHKIAFRTITDDSNLAKNIPLNSEIVKQIQKSCERQQSLIIKHSGSSSDPFLIAPVSMVKTVTKKASDTSKVNKIFKHSSSQLTAQNILNFVSKSSFVTQVNKINVGSSNSETAYVCKCTSQENMCLNEQSFNIPLSRKDSPLSILNEVLVPSLCELNSNSIEVTHQFLPQQRAAKDCDINSELCSDLCVVSDTSNLLLQNVETSHSVKSRLYNCHSFNSAHQKCSKPIKHFKRKHSEQDESEFLSNKKTIKTEKQDILKSTESLCTESIFYQKIPHNEIEKRRKQCNSSKKSKKRAISFQDGNRAKKTCFNLNAEFSGELEKPEETSTCSTSPLIVSENKKLSDFSKKEFKSPNEINYVLTENSSDIMTSYSLSVKRADNDMKNSVQCTLSKPLNSVSESENIVIKNIPSQLKKINKYSLNSSKDLICFKNNMSCKEISEKIRKERSNIQINKCSLNYDKKAILDTSHKQSNITTQQSDIFSPLLRELKLKKQSSKSLCKSKAFAVSKNFGLIGCKKSKILPLYISTKDEIKLMNSNSFSESRNAIKCLTYSRASLKISKIITKKNDQIETHHSAGSTKCFLKSLKNTLGLEPTSTMLEKKLLVQNSSKVNISNPKQLKRQNINDSLSNSFKRKYTPLDKNLEDYYKTNDSSVTLRKHLLKKNLSKSTANFSNDLNSNKNTSTTATTLMDFSSIEKSASNHNIPNAYNFCTAFHQSVSPYFDCFPTQKLKFSRGRKLLGNFEESILKGCLPPGSIVKGFYAEIGASGSFCPNHLTLPADVCFYELDNSHSGATPYVAHVTLNDSEYYLPKKGAVQVTLFNPSETVVKMFVLNYDFTNMPPLCHTFIRQKTYYMPKGSTEENPSSQKWLRFIIHLRFASSKSGKVYLHKDLKIVVLNKSNDDAASEFSQEPHELCSFLHVPMNPTYSNL